MSQDKSLAVSLGLAAGIVYLGVHAVMGQHGLLAFVDLQAQEAALQRDLDRLSGERAYLEDRVARLRGEADADYVDERTRAALGAAHSQEMLFVRATP
jgi:cell division protein FtsB